MPQTWSDWVAFIGAIVGSVTGILGLVVAYATIRRDRSDVNVNPTNEHAVKEMLESRYPGVKFGPHRVGEAPQGWFVLSAVNTGLRPVHIEKAVIVYVKTNGPGSSSGFLPHDVVLNEDHRRTSVAFGHEFTPGYRLWSAAFVDDTGREHLVFGPAYGSWLSRNRWERQRAKLLAKERALENTPSPSPKPEPKPASE